MARTSPRIVDSHFHLWHYDAREYDWISDEMGVIRRDYLAADLDAEYEARGVSAGVAVQARQSLDETRFLLEQMQLSQSIAGVVGWLDLRSDRLVAELDEFGPKLSGVRHIVQAEPDDEFLLRPDFQRGIRELRRHDLAYDILIYPKHLGIAKRFVESHPDQRFVVDHLAKPFIKDAELKRWAAELRALAAYPNVSAKLSGLVTEADWSRWKPEHLRPYLEVALEAFGPQRLMYGSDWPVCLVAASYERVLDVVRTFVAELSADEQAAILGGNAILFYKLERFIGRAPHRRSETQHR